MKRKTAFGLLLAVSLYFLTLWSFRSPDPEPALWNGVWIKVGGRIVGCGGTGSDCKWGLPQEE